MQTFTLGLDYETPFPIDGKHASVSHNHATITVDGDEWILYDNGSTNGTYVEENGCFRKIAKIRISPSTWIRLGEQGHRGYYFKARRVLSPNDYREDFNELYDMYEELQQKKSMLESKRGVTKYIGPMIGCLCTIGLSCLPGIKDDLNIIRGIMLLPGVLSPLLQSMMLNRLERDVKGLSANMICPKCRRALGKDDIISKEHAYCHAH
ncbi:MAG: FHA domain-containing protein [Muribaculaceae bacterium]